MKIFLSWSGERSKAVALALREWLKLLFGAGVEPWMSDHDIIAGERWSLEVAKELDGSDFGIVCLTKENVTALWLLFEAGALSKRLESGAVIPYLLDVEFSDILKSPLGLFQGKKAERDQTLQLTRAINAKLQPPEDGARLDALFAMSWPQLEAKLQAVQAISAAQAKVPKRPLEDIVEELIGLVRDLATSTQAVAEIPMIRADLAKVSIQVAATAALVTAPRIPSGETHNSAIGTGGGRKTSSGPWGSIGRLAKITRKAHDLSVEDVAKMAGIDANVVMMVEDGLGAEIKPPIRDAILLSLGLTPEDVREFLGQTA